MYDAFSRPLKNVTQALNITINTMEQLHRTADRNSNIAKNFDVARNSIRSAEAELAKLADDINRASREQQKLNHQLQKGSHAAKNFVKGFAGLAAAYISIKKIKDILADLFSTGVNFHAFKQGAEVALTTFLGDLEKAKQYMDDMLTFAKTTPFGYPEILTASRNMIAFGMSAENTFPVMKAIGDATAAIGGNSQKLTEIADVFGAIQVAGNISMMEVNRLHSHGIQALEMLSEKFGLTAEEMKKQISAGAVGSEAAIVALVEGIDKRFGGMMEELKGTWAGAIDTLKSSWRNAGADLMNPFMEPLTELVQNITTLFKNIPELIGPAVKAFVPFINMLNQAFDAGKFDPFFKVFSVGLTIISWLISGISMGVVWLFSTISQYWPVILAGLGVLTAIYFPAIMTFLNTMLVRLWLMIQPILAQAAAWAIAYWPITLVILAVFVLIAVLYRFGVTTEEVIGFVVGLFYSLGASIWNVIAFSWNHILAFAEFIANIFIDPVYAVKKLFYDLGMNFFKTMYNMARSAEDFAGNFMKTVNRAINSVIEGINMLIHAMNMIPGFDIGEISWRADEGNIHSVSDSIKNYMDSIEPPTSEKDVVDFSKYQMQQKNIADAFNSGYSKGSKFVSGAKDILNDTKKILDPTKMAGDFGEIGLGPGTNPGEKNKQGKKPNIGKVDRVGKIDDTVDISSEDLKVMRDLAEMKSIQNFVTLTPTVEVTTGDINNGYDVDTIIRRIEKSLEEEIASAAKGVYS